MSEPVLERGRAQGHRRCLDVDSHWCRSHCGLLLGIAWSLDGLPSGEHRRAPSLELYFLVTHVLLKLVPKG